MKSNRIIIGKALLIVMISLLFCSIAFPAAFIAPFEDQCGELELAEDFDSKDKSNLLGVTTDAIPVDLNLSSDAQIETTENFSGFHPNAQSLNSQHKVYTFRAHKKIYILYLRLLI